METFYENIPQVRTKGAENIPNPRQWTKVTDHLNRTSVYLIRVLQRTLAWSVHESATIDIEFWYQLRQHLLILFLFLQRIRAMLAEE